MTLADRNAQICSLYREGNLTQADLAAKYCISEVRVGQILNRAGLTKNERMTTPRTRFIGVNVSQVIKDTLAVEAKREGKSTSKFVSELIVRELERRGVALV